MNVIDLNDKDYEELIFKFYTYFKNAFDFEKFLKVSIKLQSSSCTIPTELYRRFFMPKQQNSRFRHEWNIQTAEIT